MTHSAAPFLLSSVCFASILMTSQIARADAPQDLVEHYAESCRQVAGMGSPAHPMGDWDIKDNPKFASYCGCFGKKFADRAVTKTQLLKTKEEIQASKAEELEMRNTCRSQFGLPSVPPKK